MFIILIAACAGPKQVIGDKNRLPWHFPSDLKFFRDTTLDQTLLMGRTTYESIIAQFGRPLPRRRVLVLSRDPAYRPAGSAEVFPSIAAALASLDPTQKLYVAGGAEIYRQLLPQADQVLLTHINLEIEGDAYFPLLDPAEWQVLSSREIIENDVRLEFKTYGRRI
jgi:dihydrofolate reductase